MRYADVVVAKPKQGVRAVSEFPPQINENNPQTGSAGTPAQAPVSASFIN